MNFKLKDIGPQLMTVIAVVLVFGFFTYNAQVNMENRGIDFGYGFLSQESSFDVQFSLIEYDGSHSYFRAYLVGLLNTILVSVIGIILATILGVVVGIARLSPNYLINKFAAFYVEFFRNIPLLLQIFFWYFAALRARVGFTIAKLLSEQGHSITVIDLSSEDIQKISDTLDVKVIVGKATYPSILEKANASEADLIITVTRNDEINMLICQIAFSIFKVPKKIARIRSQDYLNPKFTGVYNKENLPIDVIISPEIEIAKSIQQNLEAPGALDSVPFAENKIRLLEILIKKNCPLIKVKLNEITKKYPNLDANIIGLIRDNKFIIPKKMMPLTKVTRFT